MSTTPVPSLPAGLLAAVAYFLGRVPLKVRTSIYELVILLAGLATMLILLFPYAHTYGITVPARPLAILTGILTALASLARSNIFKAVMLEADAAPVPAPAANVADPAAPVAEDPIPTVDSSISIVGPSVPVAAPVPVPAVASLPQDAATVAPVVAAPVVPPTA